MRNLRGFTRALLLGGMFLAASETSATVTTLSPDFDTYVKENRPFQPFSIETHMETRVAGTATGLGRYSFLRFTVPALSGAVQSATLRVKAETSLIETGLFVLPNATFDASIVWAGIDPHIQGAVFVADSRPSAASFWLEYDVTEYVASGAPLYFGLATSDDLGNRFLLTSESGLANAPYLQITHGTNSGPNLLISRAGPPSDPWYRPGYSKLGNLGSVQAAQARSVAFTLRNTGTQTLSLGGLPTLLGTGYSLSAPGYPASLAPNQAVTVTVTLSTVATTPTVRFDGQLQIPTTELRTIPVSLFTYVTQGRECDPGSVSSDLDRVLSTDPRKHEQSATVKCWLDTDLIWQWDGGSQNKPLISNAVRLFELGEPAVVTFFQQYLDAAVLGAAGGAGQAPAKFRNLLVEELGSPNYDPITVGSILAVRAWASKQNPINTALLQRAQRWLRAYFTLAALAASQTRVDTYKDNGLAWSGHPGGYSDISVNLAGQRSCPTNWAFTTRPYMLARALNTTGTATGTEPWDTILSSLEGRYLGSSSDGNLYGLVTGEASALRSLMAGTCPAASVITGAFQNIRTAARVDIAGWRSVSGWGPVRASTSASVNGINMYGMAFVKPSSTSEVRVLFPWGDPPYPDPMDPKKTGSCNIGGTSGTVQLILTGADKRMVFTPTNGSPTTTVDLPEAAEMFRFAIDSQNAATWFCQ